MKGRTSASAKADARASESSRAEKRMEILLKAHEVFAKFGYRKTSVEDIGKACGLAGPAIYYYFASKEELFAETIRATGEKEMELQREACLSFACPKRQITEYMLRTLRSMQAYMQETQLADLTGVIPLACEAAKDLHRGAVTLVEQILTAGQQQGVFREMNVTYTAELIIACLHGSVIDRMKNPPSFSPEEGADLLVDLWLHGLSK